MIIWAIILRYKHLTDEPNYLDHSSKYFVISTKFQMISFEICCFYQFKISNKKNFDPKYPVQNFRSKISILNFPTEQFPSRIIWNSITNVIFSFLHKTFDLMTCIANNIQSILKLVIFVICKIANVLLADGLHRKICANGRKKSLGSR